MCLRLKNSVSVFRPYFTIDSDQFKRYLNRTANTGVGYSQKSKVARIEILSKFFNSINRSFDKIGDVSHLDKDEFRELLLERVNITVSGLCVRQKWGYYRFNTFKKIVSSYLLWLHKVEKVRPILSCNVKYDEINHIFIKGKKPSNTEITLKQKKHNYLTLTRPLFKEKTLKKFTATEIEILKRIIRYKVPYFQLKDKDWASNISIKKLIHRWCLYTFKYNMGYSSFYAVVTGSRIPVKKQHIPTKEEFIQRYKKHIQKGENKIVPSPAPKTIELIPARRFNG